MKSAKGLCTLLLVALFSFIEASHFRYGTLTFQKDVNDPQTVTWTLNMGMRASYFGSPGLGDTVSDDYFYFGDGNYEFISLTVNNVNPGLDLIYISWTGTHRYDSAGDYTAGWVSCCRIFALNNDPSYSYQVWSLLKLTAAEIAKTVPINNSPSSAILPIIPVPLGQVPYSYTIDSSDIDGDSRSFRMATADEQGDSGSTQPPGLSVTSTGVVTLSTALTQGYWTTQQVITDTFGNIIVVDYMLDVQPPQAYCNTTGGCSTPCLSSADCAQCGDPTASCLNALPRFVVDDLSSTNSPRTDRPTPPRSSVYTMLPDTTVTFYFTADDANLYATATPVDIEFSSLPTRMTRSAQQECIPANGCNYVGSYSEPQFVAVTYSPIRADAGSHVVCASAQSMANFLPYSQHCFTVIVSNITDVCGDSIVGVTEACDGGACCAADCKSFLSAGTVCGSPSGACGAAATCSGSTATCNPGTFASAGTVCRASVGPCDNAEVCSGSSTSCPSDSFTAAGSVCRASAGPCDVAESCSGSSSACPADTFVASGSVCRSSAGVCDVAESCSGSSAACPTDAFVASGSVCRNAAGPCDVAESCTGSSAACPANGYLTAGTTCRAANGVCDVAETCSGASAGCPSNGFASTSVVCRPAVDGCDIPEHCLGTSTACPADALNISAICSTAKDYCTRMASVGTPGNQNYFCAGPNYYDQCVSGTGNFAAKMPCPAGTSCHCAEGIDCGFGGTQSPCTA